MLEKLTIDFRKDTSIAPLIMFRVLFGFIMAVSVVRFLVNGWVYELYIKPQFYFSYYGFEWIKPLGGLGMYAVFAVMLLASAGIMAGLYYRTSAILFFLSFTYVELIDKTNYLNHYYFVSLVSFLLIFVPANRSFSLDVFRKPGLQLLSVPGWTITIFKLQLAIVYICAGIAKLNSEWLLEAMPLRIWLPANNHVPFIGSLFSKVETAYIFSWLGALYDLFIVFFLINSRTRLFAYTAVVGFHLITWLLFPIGMFPFIMILSTLIFFPENFHERMIGVVKKFFPKRSHTDTIQPLPSFSLRSPKLIYVALIVFFVIQLALPWRYLLYPGNLFWTEQGYRFSWRVMLMEKAGNVVFHVTDPETGNQGDIMPGDYLTPFQEKMMSTQPDMILQFAHFLEEDLRKKGIRDPEVRAEAYVTLNGSGTRPFIDSKVDLTKEKESFHHKDWIVSFEP